MFVEIKYAMNTITNATLQPPGTEGKIAISHATAIFAWCETRDEAAGEWLCNAYRSLVAQVVAREVWDAMLRGYLVEKALRSALAELDPAITNPRVDAWFSAVALQVCRQAVTDLEECELLAA